VVRGVFQQRGLGLSRDLRQAHLIAPPNLSTSLRLAGSHRLQVDFPMHTTLKPACCVSAPSLCSRSHGMYA